MPKNYTKNTWLDRIITGALRYDIKTDAGASLYTKVQILLNNAVTQAGSQLLAAWMNNIESGIDALDTKINAPTTALDMGNNKITSLANGVAATDAVAFQQLSVTQLAGAKMIWNSATGVSVGVGLCYAQNGDFINITSALTASGLSLSASTWYHIYVYLSAGTPAMEVVTTLPVAWKGNAYSKTGDTSRRYIGSIKTDASGNVYKFTHNVDSNYIAYNKFRSDTSPFRVLTGGVATTATSVSLAGIIPITSVMALVRFTNLADKTIYSSDDNGVGSTQNCVALTGGNVSAQTAFIQHPLDASQQFWYVYLSAPTVGAAYLDVLGYYFNR